MGPDPSPKVRTRVRTMESGSGPKSPGSAKIIKSPDRSGSGPGPDLVRSGPLPSLLDTHKVVEKNKFLLPNYSS